MREAPAGRPTRPVVDHAFARRARLAELRSGRVDRDELCDADAYLVRAARFAGEPAGRPCPVCGGAALRTVHWVFGRDLGRVAGSAQDARGLAYLEARVREFTTHLVEVCEQCRWNHLVRSYVMGTEAGPPVDPRSPRP